MVGEQTLRTTNHQLVVVECTVAVSIETKSTTSMGSTTPISSRGRDRYSVSSGGMVPSTIQRLMHSMAVRTHTQYAALLLPSA